MSGEFIVVSRREYGGKEYVKLQRNVNQYGNATSLGTRGRFWDSTNRYDKLKWTRKPGPDRTGGKGKGTASRGKGLPDRGGRGKELAEDCARSWPDPRVVKLAAAAAEGGTPLDSRTMQQIENLVAAQIQTQEQLGTLQKQMLEGRQAFQASSSESKQIQKAVEASLETLRTEQSRHLSSTRRVESLEAEQLQRALDQSLNIMRKDSLDRENKWKEESLEEILRRIRSEDVQRLEKITIDLRKEITRLQHVEREFGRVKHENTVLQTNLTEATTKLKRECKESGILRQLLGRIWFREESQERDGLWRIESAARSKITNALAQLKLETSEECGRRELMQELSAPPCNIDNDWQMMQGAKWLSAIIDPESGIRGFSVEPGRASDTGPPALVETPEQNRRRKSGARDPEIQQSSMISKAAGLAVRLYESFSPAPKKSRGDENDGGPKSDDSDGDAGDSRDRDRDDSRTGSGPSPRPLAREKWTVGQLVLAKEDRKGGFADAEIINIDNKLGVQLKWAGSGGEKWLRKDMWADRLKDSCRIEETTAAKQRV
eukprot:gene12321-biopygen7565